nr:hypothetical protein [uncultured Draconibacterium sp.]
MQTITVSSFLSTEILPEFKSIRTIEISNTIISDGEGGFGKIFKCISVNKSVCSTEQLIKILIPNKNIHKQGYKTIQKLQAKLKNKNLELMQNRASSIFKEYPALKAVPQFSFIGILNGEEVYGYSANNLSGLGFINFKEALDKRIIQQEVLENKIPIIYHLIKAFDFLSSIFIIHADLKDDALFLNMSTKECAIIDFDSGAVADNPNDQPTTFGALQDWLAPEVLEQFGRSSINLQEINVNLNSDRWSITVAIFYLICSSHPFFMLNNTATETVTDYFSKYHWPNIDPKEDYFNRDNELFYRQFVLWYNRNLSIEIKKIFETTFNDGYYNAAMRSSYTSWKYALKNIQKLPVINIFSSDKKIRTDSTPVMLHWNVNHEEELILQPGNINVAGMSSYTVNPVTDTNYILIAKNYCGVCKKELGIRISKSHPKIKTFQANALIRTGPDPIILSWNIDNCNEIILNPGNIDVNGKTSIKVEPLVDTTYTLTAKSFFDVESQKSLSIKISDEPPLIKEFKSDIPIRLNRTPIKLYWNTENAYGLYLIPGNIDVSGKTEVEVEPLNATTYSLIAESYFGVKTKADIKIDVSKESPLIRKFEYEPIDLIEDIFRLKWEVDNAEFISILPFPGDIQNRNNAEVRIVDQNEFTLDATTIFGVHSSKKIHIPTLFNITLSENLFNRKPDDRIFNLEINLKLNKKPHGKEKS